MAAAVGGVMARVLTRVPSLLALGLVAACAGNTPTAGGPGGIRAAQPQRPGLEKVSADFRSLSGWIDDDHSQALPAVQRTCRWVDAQPSDKPLGAHPAAGTTADWRPICAAARALPANDPEAARRFFEDNFTPVSLSEGQEGLFTGYYEVALHGSWTRTDRYNVPIYRTPKRTKRGIPTRSRIVDGALKGKGLEILWVDDAIDAFFLEIQGSGRVEMTDGSVVALGYAGQNGHSYYPIGRHLIDIGYATPEQVTMPLIRRWLNEHPADAKRVMNLNPSYVFFQLRPNIGARGARNMELTGGRSLAVDAGYIPLGVPLWLELRDAPVPNGEIKRLVVAQDTGGAIKGAVRGDLFWGHGPDAEEGAGVMKAKGRYTMLAPRNTSFLLAQRR
ncbi:murein transglycosylase A [Azospirillum sp. sgz302134]